ncbi:uncharacterized protein LOC116835872 [Chelonoidis abingdonii]|uniref:uncharacterized protein LOC116835872 n=1 Tax=Chelonoidis abingdonii TaxID=106734 RepID=UPI0013F17F60|nr:uncharacterized protein LOC116835872 [Chelonoidis abingdonii]
MNVPERKLYELSEARRVLLASLESNLKDLQQAQAFASSQPSSMTASKVDELTKKREILAEKLEENLKDLQQAQDFVAGQNGKERSNGSKMAHLETKKLLPERQLLSSKSAQLDHTLSALLPQDQNTKNDMEQIALRKRLLLANLPSAFPNIPPLPNPPPLQLSLTENEIQELLDKKRHLLTSQKFNLDYLSQAKALAQIQLQQNNIIAPDKKGAGLALKAAPYGSGADPCSSGTEHIRTGQKLFISTGDDRYRQNTASPVSGAEASPAPLPFAEGEEVEGSCGCDYSTAV